MDAGLFNSLKSKNKIMKNFILLIAFSLCLSLVNAQVLFEDDFSDSSNWVSSRGTGTGGALWVVDTASGKGAFPLAKIKSPTFSNGFAMFDSGGSSVWADQENWICGHSESATLTTKHPIIKEAGKLIVISFYQYYANWNAQTLVEVSTDSVNFSVSTEINDELLNNKATSNPDFERVSIIDDNVKDASKVWIRLKYIGGCGYTWYVDDIKVEYLPENDLTLNNVRYTYSIDNDYYEASTSLTQIPAHHEPGMHFWGVSTNTGGSERTNASVNVNITGPDQITSTVNGSDLTVPLASNSSEFLYIGDLENRTTLDVKGEYEMEFFVSSDGEEEITVNDTLFKKVILSDSTYAKDNGNLNSTSNEIAWYQRTGNIYEMAGDGTITSISVGIQTKTESLSQVLQVELWKFDISDTTNEKTYGWVKIDPNPFVAMSTGGASGELVIDNTHLGQLVTFPLSEPLEVKKGERFMAAIFHPLLNFNVSENRYKDVVWCVASGESDYATRVMHFIQYQGDGSPDPDETLKFNSSIPAPMIRLNVGDRFVGIDDDLDQIKGNGIILDQNIPNPFNTLTKINYNLQKGAISVTFEVVDLTGRVLFTSNQGKKSAGNYSIDFNNEGLPSGIYYYSLIVDNRRLTKKMVVTK